MAVLLMTQGAGEFDLHLVQQVPDREMRIDARTYRNDVRHHSAGTRRASFVVRPETGRLRTTSRVPGGPGEVSRQSTDHH